MLLIFLYLFSFLRTLLIILIIYYLIRWIGKIMSPPAQAHKDFTAQQKEKEGETTIRFNKKGEKIVDKNTGEYTDFEEVD